MWRMNLIRDHGIYGDLMGFGVPKLQVARGSQPQWTDPRCSVNGQCLPHEWAQKPEKPTAQGEMHLAEKIGRTFKHDLRRAIVL